MEIRHSLAPHIQLMQHQLEGIKRFILNSHGYCNFCDPGTGKTLMAIAAMNHLAHEMKVCKVLVVCPNTVKAVWAQEIRANQVYPWVVTVLDGPIQRRVKTIEAMVGNSEVIITNYESIEKLKGAIAAWGPCLIVADEAHLIKGPKTLRTKALKSIKAKMRWPMTGTPVSQSPLDVWSLIDWARPGHLISNFYAFRNRYCNIYTGAGFPLIKGYKNLPELKAKIDQVSYRVLKEECMDLPPQTFVTREVELSKDEMAKYREMAETMVMELEKDVEMAASTMLVKTLRLQQLTCGAMPHEDKLHVFGDSKLKVLDELMDSLEGRAVIIWCQFKHEVELIYDRIRKILPVDKVLKFTGEQTVEERAMAVHLFQSSRGSIVMIGTIKTGGIGITLTNASDMIFFSSTWSFSEREQAEDRIHRKGQTRPVTYYDIVAKGTIDAKVLKVLKGKQTLSNKLTGDDLRRIVYDLN